ncbi:ubiquinol-cytochrome c reductase domain-containing protein, putative [Eimeria brunetti]|uniref:Ubiquinol-cytochrome c reductase domain-containing protein, putative n=1 Tax=Eimeria brunetti TaxID=51314 RepID=U6LHJ1_9EIME|nr:ubiquinol-cytochrome c reductase domain-containing protein, putative [Eimeria brunetti]
MVGRGPLLRPPSLAAAAAPPAAAAAGAGAAAAAALVRRFSCFNHNIGPHKEDPPASEKPLYLNRFDQADDPSLFALEAAELQQQKQQQQRQQYEQHMRQLQQRDGPNQHQQQQQQQQQQQEGGGPPLLDSWDIVQPSNHPHQRKGFLKRMRYWHYHQTAEPTFPRPPDLSKGGKF